MNSHTHRTASIPALLQAQASLPGPAPVPPLPPEVTPQPLDIPPQIPPEIREPDMPGEHIPIGDNPRLPQQTCH